MIIIIMYKNHITKLASSKWPKRKQKYSRYDLSILGWFMNPTTQLSHGTLPAASIILLHRGELYSRCSI